MNRELLERQLAVAAQRRDQQASALGERGLTDKQYRTDPTWRRWNSQCRKLNVRLQRVAQKGSFGSETSEQSDED